MRALVCSEYGEGANLKIDELPTPLPQLNQVQIKVHSAGVAYVDALMVRDKHQNKHELPFAPGMSIAGIVSEVGDGVTDLQVGDRVMGLSYDGGLADYAVSAVSEVFPIPVNLDFEVAANLATAYLTPHAALHWEADLQPGERMLVLGAAGTVGSAAVELGKALGAEVIAAASTEEKLSLAREKGAEHTVCYADTNLYEAVNELTGGDGVDVVYDPVGGDLYESAFRTLGWGGRYVVIGFAGGAIPQFPANRLLVKNRKAIGFVLMYYRRKRPDRLRQTAQSLIDLVQASALSATPARILPLRQGGEAIDDYFLRRAAGSTVISL